MHQPARVMVVDDDEAMRMLMGNALEDSFAVQCVDSGTACLAAVAERRPDIVLLDVEMAELDGYDTCRQLKALGGDAPPVMFVSSQTAWPTGCRVMKPEVTTTCASRWSRPN